MAIFDMRYFITGGAGFIGSHIVDYLLKKKNKVVVYDNFSKGRKLFIEHHLQNKNFSLIKGDLKKLALLKKAMNGSDFVFHLAAHADVKSGYLDHSIDHKENLEVTQNVLEAMLTNKVKKIAFASTSSVYGDPEKHPTPEDYPLLPTSLYGATKAASEQYISTYSSYYDMNSYVFRFVSWVGERYTHGIIFDVLKKLKKNKSSIELFSDGSPRKSSLYVKDGIRAIFTVIDKSKEKDSVFNIGHDKALRVNQIVDIVLKAADKKNIKKKWLGKKSNWKGDNEFVLLSTTKLKKLGWKPKTPIDVGIKKTVDYLLAHQELLV